MTAIQIISSQETFTNLQSFNNVSELNEAVNQHIQHNRQSLNKNAVRILRHLKNYSKKYKGVSYQTKNNIAKELKLSRRTIIRNCNLLEELGIIKQYEMKRNSDFKQTSNAIQIQPYSENVTPKSHQKENLFKNNLKQETNNSNNNQLENESDSKLVQYIVNRVNDSRKQGTTIKHLSSYVDRVMRSLEKQALYHEQIKQVKAKKQRQKQSKDSRVSIPLFNWLESTESNSRALENVSLTKNLVQTEVHVRSQILNADNHLDLKAIKKELDEMGIY